MAKHFNIADMYEMVADKVPARDALVCGDQRTTFAQLEERANQLAHYLASQGVGVGDHVEVYDRSGKRVAVWESLGERAVLSSIAVAEDDVFVADAGNRVVLRYDSDG